MIKTIIVDDEIKASDFLEKMLIRYFPNKFFVCSLCESVDDAIDAIELHQPHLVFLDIQMPTKNGFDLLKELKEINFEIIFTTAHSKYAIEAIKRSALDYILKPINYIDLMEAVNRYEKKKSNLNKQKQISLLIEGIDSGETKHNRIVVSTDLGYEFLKFQSILFLEAKSNYTQFHLVDGNTIMTPKTLKFYEDLFPSDLFFRVHKTFLINVNFAKRFNKKDTPHVELITGKRIPVSIRKKDEFISKIR